MTKDIPYHDLSDIEALRAISNRQLPQRPDLTSSINGSFPMDGPDVSEEILWELCRDCWRENPKERPSMTTIIWALSRIPRKYLCRKCPEVFLRESDLKPHMRIHDSKRVKVYACLEADCDREFLSKKDLIRHTDTDHYEDRRTVANVAWT